jgi:hypothetical protein
VLYNALSNDWYSLYNKTSADATINRLNFALTQTIDLAVHSGNIKKTNYPIWFSGKLKFYVKKKDYFY